MVALPGMPTVLADSGSKVSHTLTNGAYAIVANAGTGGLVQAFDNGTFRWDESYSFYAVANSGYYFVRWDYSQTPQNSYHVGDMELVIHTSSAFKRNYSATAVFASHSPLFTVTFKDDQGTILKIQQVASGTNATPPADPVKAGYTFTGWTGNYANVTNDRIITATYSIETHAISFDSQGGSAVGGVTVNYGSLLAAPAGPVRTGYTFSGWYREMGCVNAWNFATDVVTSNTALYAKWTINSYTVTFKDWDESVLKTQTVEYHADAAPPANPGRAGYTFTGWTGNYTHVAADTTVTAGYDAVLYIVSFDSQGGSAVGSATAYYDSKIAEPVEPEQESEIFSGWYKEADCTNAWNFASDTVTSNRTLYAKWTEEMHEVSFDSQGGSAVGSMTVECESTIPAPADPVRAGYTFGGWYREPGCVSAWNFADDTLTSNIALYAKWTALPITDLPNTYTLFTGGRVAWDPQPSGGTWNWDESFFLATYNATATFIAQKAGTSVLTYTINGVSQTIIVTIESSNLPLTGQDFTLVIVLACFSGALMIAALWMGRFSLEKKSGENNKSDKQISKADG
jgi:uncharacterized repeat protein (TIGR02543 family)